MIFSIGCAETAAPPAATPETTEPAGHAMDEGLGDPAPEAGSEAPEAGSDALGAPE